MESELQTDKNLSISELTLRGFRNYSFLQLNDIKNLSIFVGNNAVGKTSIIEAIQLLTALKSFRTTTADHFIQWGFNQAAVSALFSNNVRILDIQMVVQEGKRTYQVNGKKKHIKDLKGLLPAVSFTPDDLNLVKGSFNRRRDALDDLGSQLSSNFYSVKTDYQKLIRQKSQALKDEQPSLIIESINEILSKVASQYLVFRLTLLQSLLPFLQTYYRNISNGSEDIDISYQLSWGETLSSSLFGCVEKNQLHQQINQALSAVLEEEKASKRNKIGPQSDHIIFLLNNKNASEFASQGQQRSLVLAYKMAEAAVIQEILHQKPVLLLDDVMSELDQTRRQRFLEFIQNELQTFITTTDLSYFDRDMIRNAHIYQLPFEG